MLGWWFVIDHGKSNESGPGPEHTLLTWEAGVSGLRWLDNLVESGKAQQLRAGGYPNLYEGRAADVLPAACEVIGKIDFTYKLFKPHFQVERINACQPDDIVTISAWDQS